MRKRFGDGKWYYGVVSTYAHAEKWWGVVRLPNRSFPAKGYDYWKAEASSLYRPTMTGTMRTTMRPTCSRYSSQGLTAEPSMEERHPPMHRPFICPSC